MLFSFSAFCTQFLLVLSVVYKFSRLYKKMFNCRSKWFSYVARNSFEDMNYQHKPSNLFLLVRSQIHVEIPLHLQTELPATSMAFLSKCRAEYRNGLEPKGLHPERCIPLSEDLLRCSPALSGIWQFILMFVLCTLLSHNCLGNYYAEEKFDMLNFQLSKFLLNPMPLKKFHMKVENFLSREENPGCAIALDKIGKILHR